MTPLAKYIWLIKQLQKRSMTFEWRNRSIPTQFRTSESTHSVMKMTMEWP